MSVSNSKYGSNRVVIIFLISLLFFTGLFYTGDIIQTNVRHRRMVRYAANSARESDGAPNLVILNGVEGFVADTNIFVKYMNDGYIKISGINPYGKSLWKKLSTTKLQKGTYTLTGLKGIKEETIELQLGIETGTNYLKYYSQCDENVTFSIDQDRVTFLCIRVYPYAEVNTIARPAIYMEKKVEIEK